MRNAFKQNVPVFSRKTDDEMRKIGLRIVEFDGLGA